MAKLQPMFRCYYCKATFNTEAGLRFHKAQALEQDNPAKPHWWCRLHDKDYHSQKAHALHMKQHHPRPQDLECPGCGGHFQRLGGLIGHIEAGLCSKLEIEDILNRRHEMTELTRRLNDLHGMAALASDKLQLSLEKYMIEPIAKMLAVPSNQRSTGCLPAANAVKVLEAPRANPGAQPVTPTESGIDDSETTDLPMGAEASNMYATQDSGWGSESSSANATTDTAHGIKETRYKAPILQKSSTSEYKNPWAVDDGGWYGNSKSTPDEDHKRDNTQASDVPGSTEPSLISVQSPSHALQLVPDAPEKVSIDPNSPEYDAENFRNPESDQYLCPHDHCWKLFMTPEGLAIHLRTGACTQPRYTCPACGHRFKSTTALTQHTETTTRCIIRSTSMYRNVLNLLTGGIADTDGYLEDATTKYIVQPLAAAALAPEPEEEPKTLEEQLHRTSEIMEWAERTFKERAASRAASVRGEKVPEMTLQWHGQNC